MDAEGVFAEQLVNFDLQPLPDLSTQQYNPSYTGIAMSGRLVTGIGAALGDVELRFIRDVAQHSGLCT
jgi:hypothetical protein